MWLALFPNSYLQGVIGIAISSDVEFSMALICNWARCVSPIVKGSPFGVQPKFESSQKNQRQSTARLVKTRFKFFKKLLV